jgi:hypothetical protein
MSESVQAFKSKIQQLRADGQEKQNQQLTKLALELAKNVEVGNIKKIMYDCAAFYLDSTYRIEDRVLVFDMMIQGEFVVLFEGKDDPNARMTLYYWALLMHRYWYGRTALQLELARKRGLESDPSKLTLGREETMAARFAHKHIFPNGRLILSCAFGASLNTSQFTAVLQQVMPPMPGMMGDKRHQGGEESDIFAEDIAST